MDQYSVKFSLTASTHARLVKLAEAYELKPNEVCARLLRALLEDEAGLDFYISNIDLPTPLAKPITPNKYPRNVTIAMGAKVYPRHENLLINLGKNYPHLKFKVLNRGVIEINSKGALIPHTCLIQEANRYCHMLGQKQ